MMPHFFPNIFSCSPVFLKSFYHPRINIISLAISQNYVKWPDRFCSYDHEISYLFSTLTDTKPKFNKIVSGNRFWAYMSLDFGISCTPLAEQLLLNSYNFLSLLHHTDLTFFQYFSCCCFIYI